MILGLGSDLSDIRRIQESLDRFGDRFKQRVFTELERTRSDRKADAAASYAKRFAAKEACAKALGTGMRRGVFWRVLSVQGMDIDVTYTPDGKFTAMDGQVTGDWRIDGDKLCTKSNFDPAEQCVAYPKDKKSGDSFEVTGPQGPAMIKIK